MSKKQRRNNSHHLTPILNVGSSMNEALIVIQESVDILSPGIETLLHDCIRLRSERNQLKTMSEQTVLQINETTKLNNENGEKINKHVQLQNETQKELDDTRKLYPLTKPILLDAAGAMIFPFNKQHEDINSSFSMYSPMFKSSPFGYSFILHVCSTMDFTTNENKEYLSIYIALLRSDFDSILFYPFPYNISLSLCDQSGQGKHITSIITADPKSSSFARPTSEKNNEVGIVKFCPMNYLSNAKSIYSKDGIFFIRVFIDFLNNESIPSG